MRSKDAAERYLTGGSFFNSLRRIVLYNWIKENITISLVASDKSFNASLRLNLILSINFSTSTGSPSLMVSVYCFTIL